MLSVDCPNKVYFCLNMIAQWSPARPPNVGAPALQLAHVAAPQTGVVKYVHVHGRESSNRLRLYTPLFHLASKVQHSLLCLLLHRVPADGQTTCLLCILTTVMLHQVL